jgi:transposase
MFVGLDYSKRFSVLTIIDGRGQVVKKGKLQNRRVAFEEFFQGFKRVKAVIEAGRNYHVAAELLEGLVEEIQLAHPLKVRAIAEAKIKTDSIDSETLAQLRRGNLIPQAYFRDTANREKQMVLRLRSFWVRKRTSIRNRIHWLIDGQREEVRQGAEQFTDLFGKRGRRWLSEVTLAGLVQQALGQLLDSEQQTTEKIKASDELIKDYYEADPDCRRIDTIPGFGLFLSVLAKVEIGDIRRFKSAAHLCSYAGVIPSTYSSGGKTWHGRMIKQGNRHLRWCLVEAAIHSIRDNVELRRFYLRVRRRRGGNKARIATARKLCWILYRILSQKDEFRIYPKNRQSRLQFVSGGPH